MPLREGAPGQAQRKGAFLASVRRPTGPLCGQRASRRFQKWRDLPGKNMIPEAQQWPAAPGLAGLSLGWGCRLSL